MKKDPNVVFHLKVKRHLYQKLMKEARKQMRSVHSLAIYALSEFAGKIAGGKK